MLEDTNSLDAPQFRTVSFYYPVIGPRDVDGMANGVDPDQTAPLGPVYPKT